MEQQVRHLLPYKGQNSYGWSQHLFLQVQGIQHPLLAYTDINTRYLFVFTKYVFNQVYSCYKIR